MSIYDTSQLRAQILNLLRPIGIDSAVDWFSCVVGGGAEGGPKNEVDSNFKN